MLCKKLNPITSIMESMKTFGKQNLLEAEDALNYRDRFVEPTTYN